MTKVMKNSLIAVLSIAMVLTMFPIIGGTAYADSQYYGGDGLTVTIDGDLLDVDVLPEIIDPDDDGELDYELYTSDEDDPPLPEWASSSNISSTRTIFIGEGTLILGERCFEGFKNVTTVFIPESTYWIYEYAFKNCTSIKTINYGGSSSEWYELLNDRTDPGNDVLKTATVHYETGYNDISDSDVSVELSKTSYTYAGHSFSPEVTVYNGYYPLELSEDYLALHSDRRNVGQATIYIFGYNEWKGYTEAKFKIKPKGTSISKVSSPAKKRIRVTWKKQSAKMSSSRISGYQVKVARNSSFTKEVRTFKVKGYSSTSKRIKVKYSKKKYYAKVRTYKVINGKTYYSSWSKVKSIRVR